MVKMKELYNLCASTNIALGKIEKYIIEHSITPELITRVAIKLSDKYCYEKIQFEYLNERKPKPNELVTANWKELFDLFIRYGLAPNLVFCDDGVNYENVMEMLSHIDDESVVLPIFKKLLEIGGDPNLMLGKESLIETIDTRVTIDADELQDRTLFEIELKLWLLLIGYGGKLDKRKAIKMQNGYAVDIFKDYTRLAYQYDNGKLYIILKESKKLVAVA